MIQCSSVNLQPANTAVAGLALPHCRIHLILHKEAFWSSKPVAKATRCQIKTNKNKTEKNEFAPWTVSESLGCNVRGAGHLQDGKMLFSLDQFRGFIFFVHRCGLLVDLALASF